jgi:predicted O-methyltransferase YrrM
VLSRLLREIFGARRSGRAAPLVPPEPAALKRSRKIAAAHSRAPLDRHLAILFDGARAGRRSLLEVTAEALDRTGSALPPLKVLHRRSAMQALVAYFLYARTLPGRWAECGVFSGCSSLTLCLAARSMDPAFDGTGLHLVDSFEGLGPANERDYLSVQGADGAETLVPPVLGEGTFRTDVALVKAAFADFPGVTFHTGWIPDVLATLPEARWSFVHVDVDLYAPTRACLEYFLPRLVPGGLIVCDDYGAAATFPGAARAWDEVCEAEGLPFVELPTGQAVILKDG